MKKLNKTYLIVSPDKLNILYDGVFGVKEDAKEVLKTLSFKAVVSTVEEYQKAISAKVNKPSIIK